MRLIHLSLFVAIMCALFIQNSWAGKPNRCPSSKQISAVPFAYAETLDSDQVYLYASVSKFGSHFTWAFVMAVPYNQATSVEDGRNKAQSALGTLSGDPKLQEYERGHWACVYNNSYNYISFAATPVDGLNSTSMNNSAATSQLTMTADKLVKFLATQGK